MRLFDSEKGNQEMSGRIVLAHEGKRKEKESRPSFLQIKQKGPSY